MKNLEIMGVQEMDASELKEENGGWINLLIAIAIWGLICGYNIYQANKN
jgi:lactobin A/cerein 7B family class IIb bacteriocin